MKTNNTWVVVLAGGDGMRLKTLTTGPDGVTVPKQFWSLAGGPSLLELALARAARVAAPERICVVFGAQHQAWWNPRHVTLAHENVIVEPHNRGTAIGILRAVLTVLARDPDARIVFLPADHYVADEDVLAHGIRRAMAECAAVDSRLVLLGIDPEEPDPELGYLMPGWSVNPGLFTVRRFVEKPTAAAAAWLIAQDRALWNSFIWAARGDAMRDLIARRVPEIVAGLAHAMRATEGRPTGAATIELTTLYASLPTLDFSREVLNHATERLLVRRVASCGWTDLGTPQRVVRVLRTIPPLPQALGISTRSFDTAVAMHAPANLERTA